MNNFKILTEFQEELNEFYDESEIEDLQHCYPKALYREPQTHEIEFEVITQVCEHCGKLSEFEVFVLPDRKESQCKNCKTKYEERL